MSQDELVDIVDEVNNVLYPVSKFEAHQKGLLHRTVIGAVKTTDGRICLIKQTADRQDPGQYVCPVGGHVISGETEQAALIREAEEEIGIKDFKFKLLGRKVFNRQVLNRTENHFFVVFEIIHDGAFVLGDEVEDYQYFNFEQLKKEINENPTRFGDAFKFVYENFY